MKVKRFLITEPWVQVRMVEDNVLGGSSGWQHYEIERFAGDTAVVRDAKGDWLHIDILQAGVHIIDVEPEKEGSL